MVQSSRLRASSPFALGIGAASFFREDEDEAEKDIAESPTACRNAQRKTTVNGQQSTDFGSISLKNLDFRISEKCRV